MSEWQKGDLALCIRARHCPDCGAPPQAAVGGIYTVEAAGFDRGGPWIDFAELDNSREECTDGLYHEHFEPANFRKVTPPKADEFDREVIEAMTGAPVGEPA